MISASIFTPQPYDFALTARASRFLYVMGEVTPAGAFRRVIRVGDALALVEWRQHRLLEDHIEARVLTHTGALDAGAFARKATRVIHAHAAARLTPFYLNAPPEFDATIEPLFGLTHFQADSMFEALALTIIEQQIALTMAQAAEHWLLATYGDAITHEGATYYAFPTPQRIAVLTERDLTPLKITFRRMRVLIAIAQAVAAGTLDLEGLRDLPLAQAQSALMALHGVGAWTAAWANIRGTGAYPYCSSADVALRAAVNRYFYDAKGRASRADTDALFARAGDHAGVAAFYVLARYEFDQKQK